MTLPTNSTLTAEAFNNIETMSYGTTSTVSRAAHRQQEQHPQQPQPPQIPASVSPTQPLHVATAAATIFSALELAVELVMPSIYLTKNFIAWNEANLRAHGFTHIIIIDKHIQQLYYPSPVFKLSTASSDAHLPAFDGGAFEFEFGHQPNASSSSLSFGKEFEAIDLNFGEKSYLTTVLPNCYRAVKFINKALQAGGNVLVIDCNGGEQKCVTIVVAYLMYKHNISFRTAFDRLKQFYKKADLDRFYSSQLYEYEPILQVQRAQSRGHSCSRKLHSAILKRKKRQYDDNENEINNADNLDGCFSISSEFFDTLNPLSQFNPPTTPPATTMQEQQQQQHHRTDPQTPPAYSGWDDFYAME